MYSATSKLSGALSAIIQELLVEFTAMASLLPYYTVPSAQYDQIDEYIHPI
jgi:hypothetical protein